MPVIPHDDAPLYVIPRVRTRIIVGELLASHSECSLFEQTIPVEGHIPPHYHDCEELVVLLEGTAAVAEAGETRIVPSPATLQIPAGIVHSILPSEGEVRLLAFFPRLSPRTFTPEGVERLASWNEKAAVLRK